MGLKTILLLGALLIGVIFLWESEEAPTQGSSRGRSVNVESPPRAPESPVASPPKATDMPNANTLLAHGLQKSTRPSSSITV